jgi:hypothetical protein
MCACMRLLWMTAWIPTPDTQGRLYRELARGLREGSTWSCGYRKAEGKVPMPILRLRDIDGSASQVDFEVGNTSMQGCAYYRGILSEI